MKLLIIPSRTSATAKASVTHMLMPFGGVAAGLVLAVGVVTSIHISLDTNDTTSYIPSNAFNNPVLCSSGDIAYEQTGRPYSVRLPDLKGDVLTGGGRSCLDLAPWVDNHLNYWHLFLNGVYWTYLIYVAALIPAHIIKRGVSKVRVRRAR
jgi:hypothetical protein